MWENKRLADGKRSGLKSYYYILNNLFRATINPKDGAASDVHGFVRNVLARFAPGGEFFNVPRFLWQEMRNAAEDGRRGLPYAPYLMFMIERVTGIRFPKDCIHTVYKIEKAHAGVSTQAGRASHADIPESSQERAKVGAKIRKKIGSWLKAIFGTCSYSAERAYQTQMEQRALRPSHLPPLPPVPRPPTFDLPSFSDSEREEDDQQAARDDDSDDDEEEEQQDQPADWEQQTLRGFQAARRSARFTSTTHRAGRAVVESSDDEDSDEDSE